LYRARKLSFKSALSNRMYPIAGDLQQIIRISRQRSSQPHSRAHRPPTVDAAVRCSCYEAESVGRRERDR
jgi:hypothetical protein